MDLSHPAIERLSTLKIARTIPLRSAELRIIPFRWTVRSARAALATLADRVATKEQKLESGDILVLKHQDRFKAEGQFAKLDIRPSGASQAWAFRHDLDPRVIELGLTQSRRVVRRKRGV
jgi:F420-0:gamma-glutamyl ligase